MLFCGKGSGSCFVASLERWIKLTGWLPALGTNLQPKASGGKPRYLVTESARRLCEAAVKAPPLPSGDLALRNPPKTPEPQNPSKKAKKYPPGADPKLLEKNQNKKNTNSTRSMEFSGVLITLSFFSTSFRLGPRTF